MISHNIITPGRIEVRYVILRDYHTPRKTAQSLAYDITDSENKFHPRIRISATVAPEVFEEFSRPAGPEASNPHGQRRFVNIHGQNGTSTHELEDGLRGSVLHRIIANDLAGIPEDFGQNGYDRVVVLDTTVGFLYGCVPHDLMPHQPVFIYGTRRPSSYNHKLLRHETGHIVRPTPSIGIPWLDSVESHCHTSNEPREVPFGVELIGSEYPGCIMCAPSQGHGIEEVDGKLSVQRWYLDRLPLDLCDTCTDLYDESLRQVA